jgi:hypothetical protein
VEDYFSEYKGFAKIKDLFKADWAVRNLYLSADANADDLYRYLTYLVGTAFGRRAKVLLKFNRVSFRLPWLRAKFPQAKIVHIVRDKESQWQSIVRRVQSHLGKEDVGQEDVGFDGFQLATWCQDLKTIFPELEARQSRNAFERFCKLWELSRAAHRAHADVSIDYWDLTHNFEATFASICTTIGCAVDIGSLRRLVVPPETQKRLPIRRAGWKQRMARLFDKAGRRYAKERLRAEAFWSGMTR